jgi:hypothetical protein
LSSRGIEDHFFFGHHTGVSLTEDHFLSSGVSLTRENFGNPPPPLRTDGSASLTENVTGVSDLLDHP